MDTCERCYQPIENPDEHGHMVCKLEPRRANGVIGDEIDVWVKNGLCHPGGAARHFTSRQELAAAAKERGLINYVRHVGTKGGDRSRHTSRWI